MTTEAEIEAALDVAHPPCPAIDFEGWRNSEYEQDFRDEMRKILDAAAAARWQPIEEAPRNGSEVLLLCDKSGDVGCGYFSDFYAAEGRWHPYFGLWGNVPTHFQPFPYPLKQESKK